MKFELPSVDDSLQAKTVLAKYLESFVSQGFTGSQVQKLRLNEPREVFLKLESLMPFGSYKIRGVLNAIETYRSLHGAYPKRMVTISAGNMAQAVAALGSDLNIPVRAIVPDTAPKVKIDAITRHTADIVGLPMAEVWDLIENPPESADYLLIHPLLTPEFWQAMAPLAWRLLLWRILLKWCLFRLVLAVSRLGCHPF